MKRLIFSLVLIFTVGLSVSARDINQFMSELTKYEGADHQVIDSDMLKTSINSQMPAFMEKINSLEIVTVNDCSSDEQVQIKDRLSELKDEDGNETLLNIKENGSHIRIMAKKDGEIVSEIYILVLSEGDIVVVKMSGEMNQSDLMDIVNEQKKNM